MSFKSLKATSICLRDATLTMGKVKVLDHANLTYEFTGIALLRGSNGAGKTSCLRLILGLESLQGGSIEINGNSPQLARKHTGYMPQHSSNLGGSFPAWSHVAAAIGATSWGVSVTSRKKEALALLERCSALHLAESAYSNLSGGEGQRVRLAIALAAKPTLLLLDEPFASLDIKGRKELADLFEQLSQEGCNILMSVHGEAYIKSEKLQELVIEEGQINARI